METTNNFKQRKEFDIMKNFDTIKEELIGYGLITASGALIGVATVWSVLSVSLSVKNLQHILKITGNDFWNWNY